MRSMSVLFAGVVCLFAGMLFRVLDDPHGRAAAQQSSRSAASIASSVREFGARGDGKADDTQALQRAVDSGLGEIRIPRGVYRISKPIVIDLDRVGPTSIVADGTARLVMTGAGPALKFVGTHGGTASPHTVTPNVWEQQRTPLIDGIEIVGAHPEACGVEATGTMQAIFSRVTVRDALHGIHLTKRNRNVIISECHLYDNRGIGCFLENLNLHQINITNCHISYNDAGGIVVRGSEIRNLQIGTCDIEGNMGPENEPTANILFDCTTGTVREGAIVGCTIQHTHDAPGSANVRFIGASELVNQKVGHFCIADNAMSDVAVNIHLRHARGVTITGNTLWKAFEQNLLVEGSSDVVLGDNLLDRNPDYRPNDSPNRLVFRDSRDCTITGLHVKHTLTGKAALELANCQYFNITGCSILDSDGAGMLLTGCVNCRVSDCLIADRRDEVVDKGPAILVDGGEGNQIVSNLVRGGIRVKGDGATATENQAIE